MGERFPLPPKGKTKRYEYGIVICIFMGCVYAYVIVLTLIGPEYRGRMFGAAHDSDLAEATGHEAMAVVHRRERMGGSDESGDDVVHEKGAHLTSKAV